MQSLWTPQQALMLAYMHAPILLFPLGVATVIILIILLLLCIVCVSLPFAFRPSLSLNGQWTWICMCNNHSACCTHEGEIGTDESDQLFFI